MDVIPKDVLVSIKPKYSDKILKGSKTIELRRRFPQEKTRGKRAVIYSSSPVKAITGHFLIRDVEKLTIDDLWKQFGNAACISEGDFYSYFEDAEYGYAIHVEDPQEFEEYIHIEVLRENFNFRPPQSFQYLTEEIWKFLADGQLQVSY